MKAFAVTTVTLGLALAAAGQVVRTNALTEPTGTNATPQVALIQVYKTDTSTFFPNLKRAAGAKDAQPGVAADLGLLRSYFEGKGIDVSPPFSLYYKPRTGHLLARATEEDQKAIGRLLAQVASRN